MMRSRDGSGCRTWVWVFLTMALAMGAAPAGAGQQAREDDFGVVAEAGIQYINDPSDCPGAISAVALYDNLEYYTVIDLRAQADYEMGHIPGAWHSSLGTLLEESRTICDSIQRQVEASFGD